MIEMIGWAGNRDLQKGGGVCTELCQIIRRL